MTRSEFYEKWKHLCEPHCDVASCVIADLDKVVELATKEEFSDWEQEFDARHETEDALGAWRTAALVLGCVSLNLLLHMVIS